MRSPGCIVATICLVISLALLGVLATRVLEARSSRQQGRDGRRDPRDLAGGLRIIVTNASYEYGQTLLCDPGRVSLTKARMRELLIEVLEREATTHSHWVDRYVVAGIEENDGEVFRLIGRGTVDGIAFSDGTYAIVGRTPCPMQTCNLIYKTGDWGKEILSDLRVWPGPPRSAPPKQPPSAVATFDLCCERELLADIFSRIEERCGLTFCYEDATPDEYNLDYLPLLTSPVCVNLRSVNVWQALEALAETTQRFVWSREGEVVNIISRDCLRGVNAIFS